MIVKKLCDGLQRGVVMDGSVAQLIDITALNKKRIVFTVLFKMKKATAKLTTPYRHCSY